MHGSLARYLSIAALGIGAALALSGPALAAEWDTMLRGTNSVYKAPQQAEPQQQQQQATQRAGTTVAKQGNPSGSQSSNPGDANQLQR